MNTCLLCILLAVPDRTAPVESIDGVYIAAAGMDAYRVKVYWVKGWGAIQGYFASEWRTLAGKLIHAGMFEELEDGSLRETYCFWHEIQIPVEFQASEVWQRDADGDWRIGPRLWARRKTPAP